MKDHDRCQMTYNGTPCPFPGGAAENPTKGAPLYCRYHVDSENRGTNPAQANFFQTYSSPDCVREQLEVWYGKRNWRDEAVDEMVAKHPEWSRQPGEGKTEYTGRMRKLCGVLA